MEEKILFLKKNRKKNTTLRNDYGTIIFLDYVKKNPLKDELYLPVYFNDELKINDEVALIKKLIRQKYLQKKDDGIVTITPKALSLLEERIDYVKFFYAAVPGVNIEEYEKAKRKTKGNSPFEGIMITLLLKRINECKLQDNYVGVKNLHFDVGSLYEQLGYKPQAMYHYLTCFYYEISGLEYYDEFLKYINKKCDSKDLEKVYTYTCIDPRITSSVKRLKEVYDEEMVDTVYEKNPISINICIKEKFKQLLTSIIEDSFDNKEWQIYFWKTFKELIMVADKL